MKILFAFKATTKKLFSSLDRKKIIVMKKVKVLLIYSMITVISVSISCTKDKEDISEIDLLKYKKIAWNSLLESQQEIVLHEWFEADASVVKNPDNINENVVLVLFHTPYDALTCPIRVYVAIKSEMVIYPENIELCN